MACNPSTMVDPLGLAAQYSAALSNPNVNIAPAGMAFVEGQAIMFGASLLGGGVSDMMKSIQNAMDEVSKGQRIKALWNMIMMTSGGASNTESKTLLEAIQSGEAMIKGGDLIFERYVFVGGETKIGYDPESPTPNQLTYLTDDLHLETQKISLNEYFGVPDHVDDFDGFWGKVNYVFSGGIAGRGQYNSDGDYMGGAPIMGFPPDVGPTRGVGASSLKVSGWIKRSIYKSLDPSIQIKMVLAMEKGIVSPTNSQGIIRLTSTEAATTGFTHKIKILGKGGDIRIYGNQGENGHIFFEFLKRH